jgi:hypothetical protein
MQINESVHPPLVSVSQDPLHLSDLSDIRIRLASDRRDPSPETRRDTQMVDSLLVHQLDVGLCDPRVVVLCQDRSRGCYTQCLPTSDELASVLSLRGRMNMGRTRT